MNQAQTTPQVVENSWILPVVVRPLHIIGQQGQTKRMYAVWILSFPQSNRPIHPSLTNHGIRSIKMERHYLFGEMEDGRDWFATVYMLWCMRSMNVVFVPLDRVPSPHWGIGPHRVSFGWKSRKESTAKKIRKELATNIDDNDSDFGVDHDDDLFRLGYNDEIWKSSSNDETLPTGVVPLLLVAAIFESTWIRWGQYLCLYNRQLTAMTPNLVWF
jgi:hypothetical protein